MRETQTAAPPTRSALIRTPDQRLRVFVSSTLEELGPERAAARAAIEGLRLAPVMFELGARPHPPRDLYRAYLDQSHVFVGIYWQRYGWIAPGETVSGLEDEYRLSGPRPRLIYVKKPARESEPGLARLLERIRAEDTASYRPFETADELRELIQDDLAVLMSERFEQADSHLAGRLPAWAHTNLPVPRNPLVGREAELAATCDLFRQADVGLVTLTGPGGCGKSRLALEVGLELLGQFEDGVFLITLESIRDSALVIPAIAETLRVPATPERPALDALADKLRDAHLLLVLDNFEQVVAAGPSISMLLERCPRLHILATSRTPLRIRAERRIVVPPLAVPVGLHADLQSLSQYAAVTLFIQRAQAVQPDFAVTIENAPVVAEICHRLDGLPLAIELAAARFRLLAPADLLSRLARRFEVLRGGTRDLPERQQTLRRTIDWSHDLLDEDARKVFRRLSVFAGGATLDAAEAVATGVDGVQADALGLIASLLDDSMLTSSIGELGDLRIGMLDTIREYAAEKLGESGELEDVRRRHADWYVHLAEGAEPHLVAADEAVWATRLEAERANARVALEWSATHDSELGLRIAAAMRRFWESRGSIAEGHAWFERLLRLPGEPGLVRAKVLEAASRFAAYVGDYDTAHRHISAALAIFRGTHDRAGVAQVLHEMGALALFEGNLPAARRRLEAALTMKRALGDAWGIANALCNLGLVSACEGNLERAEVLLRQALTTYESLNERYGVAGALGNLAEVTRLGGRLDDARSFTLSGLRLAREIGDKDGIAGSLDSLAKLSNATGDHATAVRLFGLASALREEAGTTPSVPEREELERELSIARAGVDEASFDAEWRAGRDLSVDGALDAWGQTCAGRR
jgi:predicted ATPase